MQRLPQRSTASRAPGASTVAEASSSTIRADDRLAGAKVRAIVDRRIAGALGEDDAPHRATRRRPVARHQLGRRGVRRLADRGAFHVDDLDRGPGQRELIAPGEALMERPPQPIDRLRREAVEIDHHLELVVLPEIAHVECADDRRPVAIALGPEVADRALDQRRHDGIGAGRIEARRGQQHRAVPIGPGIGHGEAIGGELAGMVGHDALRDIGLAHQVADMQRPGAAEGDQREGARVVALLDQHGAQRADHRVVGDAHDGERRLL